jgi:hypothetical protein
MSWSVLMFSVNITQSFGSMTLSVRSQLRPIGNDCKHVLSPPRFYFNSITLHNQKF